MSDEDLTDVTLDEARLPRLGEIGLENFPPYLMNRIMGRYNAALREEMANLGLTTPKMRTLAVLSVIDGLLIRELAIYAVVEVSTLSRALDALERGGLVRRVSDKEDSRAVRIHLTSKGRDTHEQLWPHLAGAYRQMFNGISETEQRAFVATLQAILKNVRKHPI
ncbi:MarR family transcriptional regulator [Stappia sp. BW2]|jgi:DNA-binding MarR family transcriptional regulator|uniref:MarR family winged helix-turn-helix transcriptional regulator n=1 Tax=Stappia sp. BW2 TaxID=2592622 RepID=UPI0011DEC922|nr:MarR family transcriptional regulator [Stappia sp. BW2]TYC67105.1 MarR family transcriptional regulator [Stappia sp. BW2]